jgi:hypothetical protein
VVLQQWGDKQVTSFLNQVARATSWGRKLLS